MSAFLLFFSFLLPTERRGFIVWKFSLKLLSKKRFVCKWINPAAEVAAIAHKRNDVVLHLFVFVCGKCCECFHWWKIIDRICIIWKSRRRTDRWRSLSSFRFVCWLIDVCRWLYSVRFSIAYTFIHFDIIIFGYMCPKMTSAFVIVIVNTFSSINGNNENPIIIRNITMATKTTLIFCTVNAANNEKAIITKYPILLGTSVCQRENPILIRLK